MAIKITSNLRLKLIIFLLIWLICYAIFSPIEYASEIVEDKGELNISVQKSIEGTRINNLTIKLFCIQKVTNKDTMEKEYTEDFKAYNGNNENEENYIYKIYKYAKENNIKCIEQEIQQNDTITFNNLELGTYLVISDVFYINEEKWEMQPFIMDIPTKKENGSNSYTINANPKMIKGGFNIATDGFKDENERSPKTGDMIFKYIIIAILSSSILIILIKDTNHRKKKNGSNDII